MASIPVLVFSIEKKNAFFSPSRPVKILHSEEFTWKKEFAHGYLEEVLHFAVCVNILLMVCVDFMQKKNTHTHILHFYL